MEKFAFVTTNFTGRKFMCMSLEEDPGIVEEWNQGFKLTGIYHECKLDSSGDNIIEGDENNIIILLYDEDGNTRYVDKNCFIEVDGVSNILNNMWIGLN